jgi:hypothetical protein
METQPEFLNASVGPPWACLEIGEVGNRVYIAYAPERLHWALRVAYSIPCEGAD